MKNVRTWVIPSLLAATACSAMSFQPRGVEQRGIDPGYVKLYTVDFGVACDSCRVEYGREGSTLREVVEGDWRGAVHLGALQDGQWVRVVLRAQPLGGARVVRAAIDVDGRTAASGKSDEPGEAVSLRTRVGPG
jgi:hypothetical protein